MWKILENDAGRTRKHDRRGGVGRAEVKRQVYGRGGSVQGEQVDLSKWGQGDWGIGGVYLIQKK